METVGLAVVAVVVDDTWRPGFGDPTPLGWAITLGYFAVFLLCLRCVGRGWRSGADGREGPDRLLWGVLAVFICFLGLNKQLDLQVWVCTVAKDLLNCFGLRAYLGAVRILFVTLVVGTGVVLTGGFVWLVRGILRTHALTVVGIGFLVVYMAVRGLAFFDSVDRLFGGRAGSFTIGWVLEAAGLVCVGMSALKKER